MYIACASSIGRVSTGARVRLWRAHTAYCKRWFKTRFEKREKEGDIPIYHFLEANTNVHVSAAAPRFMGNSATHSLRQYDSQLEQRHDADRGEPTIKDMGCCAIQLVLVLSLKARIRPREGLERSWKV